MKLRPEEIAAVLKAQIQDYQAEVEVEEVGTVLEVGDGYLGRVVDPLGKPIDGLGDVETDARRALELQAPGVMQRTCCFGSPVAQADFWLMIVSIAIAVLPVCRSPMIS